jgi:hypothetical protein
VNLRDWPEHNASPGPVGASAPSGPGPPEGGTDGGSDGRVTGHRARLRKTSTLSRRRPVRREPKPASGRQRNPVRGASKRCTLMLTQMQRHGCTAIYGTGARPAGQTTRAAPGTRTRDRPSRKNSQEAWHALQRNYIIPAARSSESEQASRISPVARSSGLVAHR